MTPSELADVLTSAATELDALADITKRCHVDAQGRWGDEREAREDYLRWKRIVKSLRRAAKERK